MFPDTELNAVHLCKFMRQARRERKENGGNLHGDGYGDGDGDGPMNEALTIAEHVVLTRSSVSGDDCDTPPEYMEMRRFLALKPLSAFTRSRSSSATTSRE